MDKLKKSMSSTMLKRAMAEANEEAEEDSVKTLKRIRK
jgi:hypothetical protein